MYRRVIAILLTALCIGPGLNAQAPDATHARPIAVTGSPYTSAMSNPPENCFNGIDDDGDGLADCLDGDCQVLSNGGFEDVPMNESPNSFVTFPPFPTFMGSWAAVNIDGEVFYESGSRPAYEGSKYASLLQNAGANPRMPWNETSWGAGGYDRFLFIANTYPSTDYNMAFMHAADNRYSYFGDRTLVQVQSMDTDYYFDTLIATPGYFDWTEVILPFTTDASTNSVAILFSAYSPNNASVLVDGLRLCGAVVPDVVAVDDAANVQMNTPTAIDVLANDANLPAGGLEMNIYWNNEPDHGTAVVQPDGTVIYTPDPGYLGPDEFSYEICNTLSFQHQCDVAVVSVNVVEETSMSVDTFYLSIDEEENIQLCAEYFEVAAPENTTICAGGQLGSTSVVNNDCVGYVALPDMTGTDELCIIQCGGQECDTSVFIIEILPVNDAPQAEDDLAFARIDQPVQIPILANDFDPDHTLNMANVLLLDEPVNGTVLMGPENYLTYTPFEGFAGMDSLLYLVCDDGDPALCDAARVRIRVDEAPDTSYIIIAEDASATLCLDTLGLGTSGPGTSSFSFAASGQSQSLSLSCAGYDPVPDYHGMDTLWIVNCGEVCDTSIFVIEIRPVNDKPVAKDDQAVTGMEEEVSIDVAANDEDPADGGGMDVSSLRIIEWPAFGYAAAQADGSVIYTPNAGFSGKDELRYVIFDLGEPMPARCDTARVEIHVASDEGIDCFIPESFSPNGDGLYDQFRIECADYYNDMELVVYDRYGNEVYQSGNGYRNDWEGRSLRKNEPLRDGTYFWVVKFNDGHTKDRAGHVLIWR